MDLDELFARQDGVVSRGQLTGIGLVKADLDRMLRRRELVRVHPGVFLNHTGRPEPRQRAWAAVLYAGRAALHLESAVPGAAWGSVVHVAVDVSRRVRRQPGLRIHRVTGLETKVAWHLSPPRVRVEEVVLEQAHRAPDDLRAISLLAEAVGRRLTTADRLAEALDRRGRIARRPLLASVTRDLAAGTHSVLEHGYLVRVLRPHRLPEPTARQAPRTGAHGREYRDVEHADLGVTVELDGRVHDETWVADRDADRDLDDVAAGLVALRLRYPQVFAHPCRTAVRLGAVFAARGWRGSPRPCGPGCEVGG